jgi:quercetin dioxygenase-like cupin family protein
MSGQSPMPPENTPASLLEMAPIVQGSIVSKPIMHSAGTRIILFSMDAGQIMSEHRAPFAAVVHVLEGRLTFGLGDETHDLGPHDWLVMPPNQPHDLVAEEPCRFLLTLAKGG